MANVRFLSQTRVTSHGMTVTTEAFLPRSLPSCGALASCGLRTAWPRLPAVVGHEKRTLDRLLMDARRNRCPLTYRWVTKLLPASSCPNPLVSPPVRMYVGDERPCHTPNPSLHDAAGFVVLTRKCGACNAGSPRLTQDTMAIPCPRRLAANDYVVTMAHMMQSGRFRNSPLSMCPLLRHSHLTHTLARLQIKKSKGEARLMQVLTWNSTPKKSKDMLAHQWRGIDAWP